jgi:hypothetical protein
MTVGSSLLLLFTAALVVITWLSQHRSLSVQLFAGVECHYPFDRPLVVSPSLCGVHWTHNSTGSTLDIRTYAHPSDCEQGTSPTVLWHFDSLGPRMDVDREGHCLLGFQHVVGLNHTLMPLSAMVVLQWPEHTAQWMAVLFGLGTIGPLGPLFW